MNKNKKIIEKYNFLSYKIYIMMIHIFIIYPNDPFLSNIKIK
jgi:hypothetical protein